MKSKEDAEAGGNQMTKIGTLPAPDIQDLQNIPEDMPRVMVTLQDAIILVGTNGKTIGWIDTHEWLKGHTYRDRLVNSGPKIEKPDQFKKLEEILKHRSNVHLIPLGEKDEPLVKLVDPEFTFRVETTRILGKEEMLLRIFSGTVAQAANRCYEDQESLVLVRVNSKEGNSLECIDIAVIPIGKGRYK